MPLRPNDVSFLPQLARVLEAGVHVITLNVAFGNQGPQSALAMLSSLRQWLADRADHYVLIDGVTDIQRTQACGKLGVCFDVEGMDALGGDIDMVGAFYRLGVRWMLAAYNLPSAAGGGCLAEDSGLTSFGRKVLAEMNRVGMVICGSHCGYRTAREMIDLSADPVIFSHSNPRARHDHPRNIPDDLMKACAARGGVIGINGFGPFLGGDPGDLLDAFIAHLEYTLDLLGDDHVGIALDYVFDRDELDTFIRENPGTFPPGLYSHGTSMIAPWQLHAIRQRLVKRGHSENSLRKVFGENHMRVARRVWRD
jgi:membrane dipeptidase